MNSATTVLIDSIKPDPQQPRKIFDEKHIEGLGVSLGIEGMINPIEIDKNMMIITGECRWRAARKIGWKEVPVSINDREFGEYERLRHQMAENVHQSGSTYDTLMNPVDTATGYARLVVMKYYSKQPTPPGGVGIAEVAVMKRDNLLKKYHQISEEVMKSGGQIESLIDELAKEVGIGQSTIYENFQLLNQPEYLVQAVESRKVPRTYVREAERAPEEVKEEIKKKIAAGDYKSREEIVQDVTIARQIPDMADLELERQKAQESAATNRILNGIARLALALEGLPLNAVDIREKGLVKKQLDWLQGKIGEYLSA